MAGNTKIIVLIIFVIFAAFIFGCSVDTHVPVGRVKMRFSANEIERIFGAMSEASLEDGLFFSSETRRIDGEIAVIATVREDGCVAAVAYGYKKNNSAEIFFYKCKAFDPGVFTDDFIKNLERRKIDVRLEMKGLKELRFPRKLPRQSDTLKK